MRAIICGDLMALVIKTANAQQNCPAGLQSCVRGSGLRPPGYWLLCGSDQRADFPVTHRVRRDPTFLQILLVVVRFIEARPQRMDEAFVGLAFEALLEAWPCHRTPGPPS